MRNADLFYSVRLFFFLLLLKPLFSLGVRLTPFLYLIQVLLEATDELLPLVYTPHVGAVCQSFSHLFPFAKSDGRGLFLSIQDKGQIATKLRALRRDVRAIVVTDGQRILGLGDLGINGMGIPIGKLALYTALAGVPPNQCLPITLDVGTNTQSILSDPAYLGNRHERITGAAYEEFLEEFVSACHSVFDKPLIQFEDFGNLNAFQLLHTYQKKVCCFNDDIQGTASVVLAGVLAAARVTNQKVHQQTYLLFGAGKITLDSIIYQLSIIIVINSEICFQF